VTFFCDYSWEIKAWPKMADTLWDLCDLAELISCFVIAKSKLTKWIVSYSIEFFRSAYDKSRVISTKLYLLNLFSFEINIKGRWSNNHLFCDWPLKTTKIIPSANFDLPVNKKSSLTRSNNNLVHSLHHFYWNIVSIKAAYWTVFTASPWKRYSFVV